jgi:hypothetical protein
VTRLDLGDSSVFDDHVLIVNCRFPRAVNDSHVREYDGGRLHADKRLNFRRQFHDLCANGA